MNTDNKKYNNLINEKSPYLLQHASNPVDWHSWNDETFKKANTEDKPIFLSIGYSTCHWCHVMEHESFEDEEVANLLNKNFINIKVDREERPDIDKIYMTACQMMTGKGGWPLTIIMTPDKKPFFAATYIPKKNRYGIPGMLDLIPNVSQIWQSRRDEVNDNSEKITESLNRMNHQNENFYVPDNIISSSYEMFKQMYDAENGGFGERPKFPTPQNLLFLLRYWKTSGIRTALGMVEKTLKKMRYGGIFDQIGFGFHRYSTDEKWILPHFEKMLYDQALLSIAYLETYQVTGDDFYKETAEEIFTYILRGMTSDEGGFFSAEDADSEGVEGKFYLWEVNELKNNLSEEDFHFLNEVFELQHEGNFVEESSRTKTGENILYYKKDFHELAEKIKTTEKELRNKTKKILAGLYKVREHRTKPHLDDKILTDWNGMLCAAFAMGARITGNTEYSNAAEKSIEFIKKFMIKDGRLYHRFREGETAVAGNLDDYTYFIWGLIETYQTTYRAEYLTLALNLSEDLIKYFYDSKNGALFFTPVDGEDLISRSMDFYDGAIPSGNSIAAYNFNRLFQITGDTNWLTYSESIFLRASNVMNQYPIGFSMLLSTYMQRSNDTIELVICCDSMDDELRNILNNFNRVYLPGAVVIIKQENSDDELLKKIPYLKDFKKINNKITFYACRNGQCNKPSNDINKIIEEVLSNG